MGGPCSSSDGTISPKMTHEGTPPAVTVRQHVPGCGLFNRDSIRTDEEEEIDGIFADFLSPAHEPAERTISRDVYPPGYST